ncbi:MAG: response regulator, partial [Gammaproteobacteria bacterium]|nr:response regulator [Gammaproteobacteria bacterium]
MSEKESNHNNQNENIRLLSEFTENILIVDDEQRYLNSLREIMSQNGFNVELAHNGAEAIERLKTKTIGLLLLDLNMPDISGDEVMQFIKSNKINTTVIVVSGESSFEAANSALKHGAYDYIKKPYATDNLLNSVNNALKKRQL